MELLKQIAQRRAYRAYSDRPIPESTLERLARAAHAAPSFMNRQPWRIVMATDPEVLQSLKGALTAGNYWAKPAPAIAAFVTSPEWDGRLDGGREYALFDLGQAAMALQLQAVAEGLIAHPIAGFDAATAKKVLGIPDSLILETLVILGFAGDPAGLNERHRASEESPRLRKPLDEVFARDRWNEALFPRN